MLCLCLVIEFTGAARLRVALIVSGMQASWRVFLHQWTDTEGVVPAALAAELETSRSQDVQERSVCAIAVAEIDHGLLASSSSDGEEGAVASVAGCCLPNC